MKEIQFDRKMMCIESALKEKGYDPYEQLLGYIRTGSPAYITRHREARSLIQTLDMEEIWQYAQKWR